VTFFIPLTAAVCFHRPVLRNIPRMLIWFLPLGGVLLPVSPFPRVWFVLFPLWALLTAGYLRKVPEKYWRILRIATVVWGLFTTLEFTRELLSPAVSLGGQDDFYAPYFMKKDFLPSETAGFINTNFPENHPVFVSFGADPPALWYFRHTAVLDIPPGRCTGLPSGTVLVLGIREDTELFETRFQTRLYEIWRNKLHKICLVTGEGI